MTAPTPHATPAVAPQTAPQPHPGYIYLASPYTHDDPAISYQRVHDVVSVAARLMLGGRVVYCPVAHGVLIASVNLPDDQVANQPHDWWMAQCLPLLTRASELWVLQLDGWATSQGVQQEIAWAQQLGLPIKRSRDGTLWVPDTMATTATSTPHPAAATA